jgi:SAM-dependent methyltransferase
MNDGKGIDGLLERALIRNAKSDTGVTRTAGGELPYECKLCGKGKLEFAFALPALDGPYANVTGNPRRSFFKCETCGFLSVEPFDADLYLTYYSRLNGCYHYQHDTDTARYQTVARMMERLEVHRVLDLGCGTGKFLSMLPDRIAKYGVELSAAAVKSAQERGVEILRESDLENPSFSRSFDAVTAIDVAEHISNVPEWGRKIAHVLRPGGYFIFMTGNLDSWWARTLGRHWYYLHYAEHVSFLTETAARLWLAPEFEDVQIELLTHHEIGVMDLVKCVARFCVAWTLQELGAASRFRISTRLPATSDHMLVCARRRSS